MSGMGRYPWEPEDPLARLRYPGGLNGIEALRSVSTPSVEIHPLIILRTLAFLVGVVLTIWAFYSYRSFDPHVALMSQPHRWLLISLYVLWPRGMALYYLGCAQPPAGHWMEVSILGCLVMPGGWGAYVLPGVSQAHALRLGWGIAGFVVRDVVIKSAVSISLRKWAADVRRRSGAGAAISVPNAPALVVSCIFIGVIGWGWLIAMHQTKTEIITKMNHEFETKIEALTSPLTDFWPGSTAFEKRDGFLVSENCVPLRAIAGRPNVTLFESYEVVSPLSVTGVAGTMRVWLPYFVFDRKDKAVLVGESLRTPESERRWAPIGLCFCWTTRECLSLEKDVPTYGTLEEAKTDATTTRAVYRYPYKGHFITDPSKRDVAAFQVAALPVLDRKETVYWRIAKPEGGAKGYETCWIKWDGKDDAVVLRFRTTRVEFERYLNGILKLEREFRELNKGLLGKGLDYLTAADLSERTEAAHLKKRLDGIPKLVGYMERPPESMEEYQELKKKALRLLEVSSSPELWDCNEVAYLAPDMVY